MSDEFEKLDMLQRDPYPTYARARKDPGLTFVPELNAWLVARDADAREVLRRPQDFSSANAIHPDIPPTPAVIAELSQGMGGMPTVVTSDGAEHQRYRTPLSRGLSSARVAAVIPFIRERATALVDSFASDGQVELMGNYAKRLPGEVIGHLLGLDQQDVAFAIHGSYRAEELLFRPLDAAEQVRAARDVATLQHLLDGYARRRRDRPRTDLCSEMVQALAPGTAELTVEQRREIVSNLQNLLIAGHLTTTALIGTSVLRLLQHRQQWEQLCARPELIPAAVEEAARYDTPVQGFRRITTRPVALAGTDLPAGTEVFVAFGSANRDETTYDQPNTFDITRTPTRHLAFGHGVHACPGASLAREQVRITLETLTHRFPELRLAPDQPISMLPTLIHRSPRNLHLNW
jgi:cytochrome P450